MLAVFVSLALSPDLLVASFDEGTYGGWTATGTAFGRAPATGTLPNQMPVSGFQGTGLVNTFLGGDASTGSLTSPSFRIQRRFIRFLIGGGADRDRLKLELIVDGKTVRQATGWNRRPGGSERLYPSGWDVRSWKGRLARLRIVDTGTGPWGHLNVDHILQTDRKPTMTREHVHRTLTIRHRFLNVPIKNGALAREVTIQVEGGTPVTNTIELADGEPDWFASVDVSPWIGRKLTLTVDRLPSDSRALERINNAPEIAGDVPPYHEADRGQLSFSPRRGWTNDPNGLVFFRGEYHLFFQHNPYGWGWGNMHWGHAVSKDLVHWEELPIALFPDPMGTMFSGSAVVDTTNASQLGKPGEPAMLLFYTAAGSPFVQGLAWSLDGRTFHKYSGNPIVGSLATGDRDPKVVWDESSRRWIMALYLEIPGKPTVQVLASTDLKSWQPLSQVVGYHECPDFFELPVLGSSGEKRWVLTGANRDYQTGTFDGETFRPDGPILKGHAGRGFYAAQTFSDIPDRRIQIGWFQSETPGMPFNQSMTVPLELALVQTADGIRLKTLPAKEIEVLRAATWKGTPRALEPGAPNPLQATEAELADVELEVDAEPGAHVELTVRGVVLRFDPGAGVLEAPDLGLKGSWPAKPGGASLRVICDRVGLEVFGGEGLVFMPIAGKLDPKNRRFSMRAVDGRVHLRSLKVHTLRSIWR